ncbi:30S ribosome-binding factor RbfA [Buchananella felis]|uniref:30S ribosome-binding factor RbfA n=1 Tax=Buchananella felis TaxID=3231492 RepID=UPI0035272E2E
MADDARARKVADRIHETVARLLDTRVKDPRLGFVTVTEVRVTGDLQQATVFYTVLGDEPAEGSSAAALASATGMLRSEVGRALGIRLTPTLTFVRDALPETAASLEDALVAAAAKDAEVARLAEGATYAGDANPYKEKKERVEDDFDDDADWDDEEWDEEADEAEFDDEAGAVDDVAAGAEDAAASGEDAK